MDTPPAPSESAASIDTVIESDPTAPASAAPPEPDLAARIAELERDLRRAQQAARQAETRAHIHRALAGAGAIDIDAVALVVEAALPRDAGAHDAAGVARIVEEIRRTRPALFHAGARRGATMTARVERPRTGLEEAALHAARTGDRTALLHYLRMKRSS